MVDDMDDVMTTIEQFIKKMKLVVSLHENVLFNVEKIIKEAKVNICHQERKTKLWGICFKENNGQNEKAEEKKKFQI